MTCLYCDRPAYTGVTMSVGTTPEGETYRAPVIGGTMGGDPIVCAAHVSHHLREAHGYTEQHKETSDALTA